MIAQVGTRRSADTVIKLVSKQRVQTLPRLYDESERISGNIKFHMKISVEGNA